MVGLRDSAHLEVSRKQHNRLGEQTRRATFPSGIHVKRIHSHIAPPHPHHVLVLCASSSHTSVSSRSRERRLLNHDWSGNPLQKIGGIKQKMEYKKRSFNFRLCTANPLPREAWCCVSRLQCKKKKTRTPFLCAVMRRVVGCIHKNENKQSMGLLRGIEIVPLWRRLAVTLERI